MGYSRIVTEVTIAGRTGCLVKDDWENLLLRIPVKTEETEDVQGKIIALVNEAISANPQQLDFSNLLRVSWILPGSVFSVSRSARLYEGPYSQLAWRCVSELNSASVLQRWLGLEVIVKRDLDEWSKAQIARYQKGF